MPLVIGVLLAALGGCTGAKVNSRAGIPTIVVVTRHADTDPGSGVLNATERERAQALADLVAPMGVTGIYSPDLVAHPHDHAPRVPLQDLLGDGPGREDADRGLPRDLDAGEPSQRLDGGQVPLVSGNLQAVYGRLGGDGMGPVEYGDLHILTIPPSGPVRVEKLRYGP